MEGKNLSLMGFFRLDILEMVLYQVELEEGLVVNKTVLVLLCK